MHKLFVIILHIYCQVLKLPHMKCLKSHVGPVHVCLSLTQ